jgi:hypothetical protein
VSSFSSSSLSLHFFSSAIDDWFRIAFAFSMTDAFATKLHANQKLLQRRDIVWRTGSVTHVPSGLCEENTVCFSSIVIFLLVCVKDPRLFLKSRHLPSGLCEGNPSVSQVSSSSFWFVWTKPVCFSNLVIFLLVCLRKTCLFLESRPLPSGLCEENGLCFSITAWSFLLQFRMEKSGLFRCYGFFFFFFLVQLLEGYESVCKSPERFLTVVIVSELLENLNCM